MSWVLQDTSFSELYQELGQTQIGWVFASMLFSVLSCWFRTLRWQLQLEVGGYKASSSSIFTALMVGYFVNQLLPRTGELVRCSVLPQSKSFFPMAIGTVFVERLIDMLVLVMLLGLILLLEFSTIQTYLMKTALGQLSMRDFPIQFLLNVSLGGIALCVCLAWFLSSQYPKYLAIIQAFVHKVWIGISSVFRLRSPLAFLGYTVLIWCCYWGMTVVIFFAFPISQPIQLGAIFYAGVIVMIMGAIGSALPIPGGIGAYHAAVIFTFAALGLEKVVGSEMSGEVYALVAHGSRMIILVLVGGIAALMLGIRSSTGLSKT